jgi:hypothetical protein
VLEAQKMILDSLAKSYSGTAAAVANAQPWTRLTSTLKQLSADALRPLLPEFDSLVKRADDWATHLEHNSAAQEKLKKDINEVIGTAKQFADGANTVAGALGGWRHVIETIAALKFASIVTGWAGALKTLIGTETAGLIGAEAESASLLTKLRLLTAKPWVIAIALSAIPQNSKGQSALDKAGIGFLGRLPVIGGAFQQEAALEAKIFGPSWGARGGGAPQVQTAPGSTGIAYNKSAQNVTNYATKYGPSSGITYHWGGVSPISGFDCSGYVYAAYAAAGIQIPRDTRGQWNDPHAVDVPKGSEKPGDAVFFTGDLTGKNAGPPPGHVGIYIGGGRFIEYFSEGKPAKIDFLGGRGDYMGARRWLKITDTGKHGAAPPKGGGGTSTSTSPIPATIRQAIAAADVAAASAALTPGKADDRAAIQQQRRALEEEIAWLRSKLATNLGTEKRITLEDLLTGALGDLGSLTKTKKTTATGATITAVTALRNTVSEDLKGLPKTLDDVEQNAVEHLKSLRAKLKVGLSAKELAETRAGIQDWGKVLKSEISKQAKIAADAANEAARLWQRGWTNDVNRVLRDFQENVVQKQLDSFDKETSDHLAALQAAYKAQSDAFDRETKTGLQRISDLYAAKTPEEQALDAFRAQRSASAEAKQKAQLQAEISDVQSQLAALDQAGQTAAQSAAQASDTVTGALIDIATGQRTAITSSADATAAAASSTTDIVQQRKDLLQKLADLQDQYQQLELDDQETALQAAADASRQAADKQAADAEQAYQDDRDAQRAAMDQKEADAEQAYQSERDGQRQHLQDMLDDQATALQQDLDDWGVWLDAKKKSWAEFLAWMRAHGLSTAGIGNPADSTAGTASPGDFQETPVTTLITPGHVIPFAAGGRVPGVYVGRQDTIMARVTPGERVLDRRVNEMLEDLAMGGARGGGPTVAIFSLDGHEFARAVADPITAEQARQIGYTIQRG